MLQGVYGLSYTAIIFKLLLAMSCGGVIGAERLMSGRAAGLRTHMVVSLGSVLTALIGVYCYTRLGYTSTDPLRISAQVVSGIGFLGVGTILIRGRNEVTGLTTAAGLWTTAAIGMGIGFDCYFMSVAVAVLTFFSIWIVSRFEDYLKKYRRHYELYIEADDVENVNQITDLLKKNYKIEELDVTQPRSGYKKSVGMEVVFTESHGKKPEDVISEIRAYEHVIYVLESI